MRNLREKIPGAPNFRYSEFIKSETATRLGIKNIPNDSQWQNIEALAINVLQPVRSHFGRIKITSGFRIGELNKKIGGSEFSNHCRGEAADIEPMKKGVTLLEILSWIYRNLEFRNLIAEYFDDDGWVHVDFRAGSNLKRLRLRDKEHKYEDVTIEFLKELYSKKSGDNIAPKRCLRSCWKLFRWLS